MKRFIILVLTAFIISNCAYAADETVNTPKNIQAIVYSQDKMFGLKSGNGEIITKAEFKKIIRLGKTGWIIQKKNRYGIINNSGELLVKPKYRHVERLFGSFVKLGNENDFAVYNEFGEIVIPPEYTSIDMLFGGLFLTKKNYKYGVIDRQGKVILENIFDDIYMPKPNIMRIEYNGQWYQIEQIHKGDFELPEDIKDIKHDDNFKVTEFIKDPVTASGYSAVTFTDYFLKMFSSISPSHEETIDDLMLSQGAETVNIFIKFTWLPKYPFTFLKKYYHNIKTPNNGPLSGVKKDLKQKIKK